LTLLRLKPAELSPLRAQIDGNPVRIEMEEIRAGYLTGALRLEPGSGTSGPVLLTLEYDVDGGDGVGPVVLPLVTPRLAPSDPGPRTFLATVEIPEGLTVTESFPSSVLERPAASRGGSWVVGLQGVPAMVSLRVSEGRGVLFSLERVLDLGVLAGLLLMGAWGLSRLRAGR
jgi:hypothetical protein